MESHQFEDPTQSKVSKQASLWRLVGSIVGWGTGGRPAQGEINTVMLEDITLVIGTDATDNGM